MIDEPLKSRFLSDISRAIVCVWLLFCACVSHTGGIILEVEHVMHASAIGVCLLSVCTPWPMARYLLFLYSSRRRSTSGLSLPRTVCCTGLGSSPSKCIGSKCMLSNVYQQPWAPSLCTAVSCGGRTPPCGPHRRPRTHTSGRRPAGGLAAARRAAHLA